MTNMSTYLADKLLDHAWGVAAYTEPTVYLALFTTNPTMPDGTGGVEVSGGSYARVALAGLIGSASAGANANSALIQFPTATASWGTIVGVGAFDALTVGNLLNAGPLTISKAIGSGDIFEITVGSLTDSLA